MNGETRPWVTVEVDLSCGHTVTVSAAPGSPLVRGDECDLRCDECGGLRLVDYVEVVS